MNKMNHRQHDTNPDYWNILLGDTQNQTFADKVGLDFGCGCGRNVFNIHDRFKTMYGVDISPELIKTCQKNTEELGIDSSRVSFHVCDGVSLSCFEDSMFDFIMSTIVLQHICVHTIRYNYLKEFFRCMKPGGLLSFQMGFGNAHPNTRDYYEDYLDATSTNSACDVRVDNPECIIKDLTQIGFTDISFTVSNAWEDLHRQWIFVKAYKPTEKKDE
jgi:ubiquinone/menaquinone biosynthesis C-methylase UbiE